MSREEYLLYREQEEVPVALYYEYYLDKKDPSKELISLIDFGQVLDAFLFNYSESIVMTEYGQRSIRWDDVLFKIYNYFNVKFEC